MSYGCTLNRLIVDNVWRRVIKCVILWKTWCIEATRDVHVLISSAYVIMTTGGDDSAETVSPINAKELKITIHKNITTRQ